MRNESFCRLTSIVAIATVTVLLGITPQLFAQSQAFTATLSGTVSDPGGALVSGAMLTLGDREQAMTWLEQGYEERFNPGVLLRPGFDPLRSDPRFQALARRVGLNK